MKKLLCSVCLVVGLFVGVHAQLDEQVEQALQRGLNKQDCQIHDMYTKSYLKKASQEQKSLVITRSNKDWRKLHLLGDLYRFDRTNSMAVKDATDFSNVYVNARAEQYISIRKFNAKSTPQEVMAYIKDLFDGTNFKLQTYDPGNQEEGMMSFLRSNRDGTVSYMVFRIVKGPGGKVFMGRVSRRLERADISIMQGIFRALKQTPTRTLAEHFVEHECQMGADCY